MELLQKLTLYDLLGYALPGSLALWLCRWDGTMASLEQMGGVKTGYWVILAVLGYVIGNMISQCTIVLPDGKGCADFWSNICKNYGISLEDMSNALKNAGIIKDVSEMTGIEMLENYETRIFSDIQTDVKYNRLHIYASMELFCKNMAGVAVLGILIGIIRGIQPEAVIGIIGLVVFMCRWKYFLQRRLGYTMCWFIKKYNKQSQKKRKRAKVFFYPVDI